MIVSERPNRSSSRWLPACVLLCAVAVLPLGLGHAAESDREAEMEAVGMKIKAAIAAGKITEEQGWARWKAYLKSIGHTPQKQRSREEMAAAGKKIEAAVEAGEITAEEGRAKMEAYRKKLGAGARAKQPSREEKAAVKAKIAAAIEAGEITAEQGLTRWEGYLNRVRGGKRDEGLAGHYKRMGVSLETLGRIKKVLVDNGVKPEQMEGTLGGLTRVAYEVKSEGEAFELDPRLRDYFTKRVGLTDKQIELVIKLARRIAHGMKDSSRRQITREDYARAEADLKKAVAEGKISEEDARARLAGMRKMMAAQSERGKEVDWEAIKRRIESAVESGRLTREQADAKYREIKARMAAEGDKD